MRGAEEPDMRRPSPDPSYKEHRGQQALHTAGRHVYEQPIDLAMVSPIMDCLEMLADSPDMPAFRELITRLDNVPSLTDKLNQAVFCGFF